VGHVVESEQKKEGPGNIWPFLRQRKGSITVFVENGGVSRSGYPEELFGEKEWPDLSGLSSKNKKKKEERCFPLIRVSVKAKPRFAPKKEGGRRKKEGSIYM